MNRYRIVAALIPVLLLLVAGCEDEDRYTLKFSHSLHIEDVGLQCVDCHGEMTEAGGWKMPDHDTCTDCHEDAIEGDIAEDTCGTCHVEKPDDFGAKVENLDEASHHVFEHTVSLEGRCKECHSDLLNPDSEFIVAKSRQDFVELRDKAHSKGEPCWTCHESLSPNLKPDSHNSEWKRQHGIFFQADEGLCKSCHVEETCRECHQQERPSSHTNLFRTKTHGIEASWNREKCQTCHQEDFCSSCHMEVQPKSHSANWEDRHCFQCHASSEGPGTGCATCHKGGIEVHDDLTPPSWHANLNISCFTAGCHGPADGGPAKLVPSKHPFLDETECTNCHRL